MEYSQNQYRLLFEDGESEMLIRCKCGNKAKIASRNTFSNIYTELYCACTDVTCGHTFAMSLSFKHSITPPASEVNQFLFEFVKNMPADKREELMKQTA